MELVDYSFQQHAPVGIPSPPPPRAGSLISMPAGARESVPPSPESVPPPATDSIPPPSAAVVPDLAADDEAVTAKIASVVPPPMAQPDRDGLADVKGAGSGRGKSALVALALLVFALGALWVSRRDGARTSEPAHVTVPQPAAVAEPEPVRIAVPPPPPEPEPVAEPDRPAAKQPAPAPVPVQRAVVSKNVSKPVAAPKPRPKSRPKRKFVPDDI